MSDRLVIAGADGYIGRRIQSTLTEKRRMILLCPNNGDGYLHLDLRETGKFDFSIISSGDMVLVLAGISSPDLCSSDFRMAFDVNVRGTISFIESCLARGARVLFFSSDTVYGDSEAENTEDILPENPSGEYGMMKYLVERYFRGESGFKSFRLSYVFSWDDKYTAYLRSCLEQERAAEVFDPLIRKAVYINDLIECVSLLHSNWSAFENQYFNICGPEYLSRVDMAKNFSKHIGPLDLRIIRPDENFYRARPQKINISSKYSRALLGRDFTPIEEALRMEKDKIFN